MARAATLNVSLTPRLERYVRKKVASGRYESASEVIRESLRALQASESGAAAFWADVRGKVAAARKEVTAGDVVDGEKAMDQIIADLAKPRPATRSKRISR